MTNFGAYLKDVRNNRHLSLKDVHNRCGITDSRLSRVERGDIKILTLPELKKLARLYDLDIVSLYIMAGYLEESDLQQYQLVFQRASLLNEEERQSVQKQIDLLTRGRKEDEK